MRFGIFHHPIDFILGQSGRSGNSDLLLTTCSHVLGGHVNNTVCVKIEGHFNLWHTARCRWNSNEMELTERAIVTRHRSLTLKYVNLNRSLVIRSRREDLRLSSRDRSVALD